MLNGFSMYHYGILRLIQGYFLCLQVQVFFVYERHLDFENLYMTSTETKSVFSFSL